MLEGTGGIVPGTIVAGQYRIEAILGEGGYGAVYAAIQLHLGRRVALKLLHPDVLTRSTALARFKREAQLAQGLSHPNTVRLFDFGEAYGRPYIAYEFLDGRSLEAVITSEGCLAPKRVARIASQTLKALIEAHEKNIVHRDIKPGNLFICNFAGEPDYVKVLDFGIASAATPGDGSALTQEGTTLGTPAYMAPEQALALPLDGRADIYSVGLVMAEALCARRIFAGATAMEILIAQASDKPVPLPDEIYASPLGNIVRAATMKNRDHRFASARAMLEAVEQASGSLSAVSGTLPSRVVVTPGSLPPGAAPLLQQAQTAFASATPPTPAAAWDPRFAQQQPRPHTAPANLTPGPAPMTQGSTLSGSEFAGARPPPRPSSPLPIIAGVLGVVFLVMAGFGAWAIYTYQSAVDRSRHAHNTTTKTKTSDTSTSDDSTDDDPPHTTPKKPDPPPKLAAAQAVAPDFVKGCTVRGKTAQQILDRMTALGWNFLQMSDMDIGFGRSAQFTYENKDDAIAILKLSKASSAPMITTMPGEKVVRENGCVVDLMVTSEDADFLDAPIDTLFK